MHFLEIKEYTKDSSQEEIEVLMRRVFLYEKDLIIYREMPLVSDFQLDIYFNKLKGMVDLRKKYYMIIDLTETQSSTLWEIKRKTKQMFTPFLSIVKHLSINTGKNVTLNITARFLYKNVGFNSCSYHTSFSKALKSVSAKRRIHKKHSLKSSESSLSEVVYQRQA
jgi:hypothetical protein